MHPKPKVILWYFSTKQNKKASPTYLQKNAIMRKQPAKEGQGIRHEKHREREKWQKHLKRGILLLLLLLCFGRSIFNNMTWVTFTIRVKTYWKEPAPCWKSRSGKRRKKVPLPGRQCTVYPGMSSCLVPAGLSASLLWILQMTVSAVRAASPLMFKPSSLPPSSQTWDQRGESPQRKITP